MVVSGSASGLSFCSFQKAAHSSRRAAEQDLSTHRFAPHSTSPCDPPLPGEEGFAHLLCNLLVTLSNIYLRPGQRHGPMAKEHWQFRWFRDVGWKGRGVYPTPKQDRLLLLLHAPVVAPLGGVVDFIPANITTTTAATTMASGKTMLPSPLCSRQV